MNIQRSRHMGRYFFILFFAFLLFSLLCFSASSEVTIKKLASRSYELSITESEEVMLKYTTDNDSQVTGTIKIDSSNKHTLNLEGKTMPLYKPLITMEAILLPNNIIGLRCEGGNKYLVPNNCSILYSDEKPVLYLNDENQALLLDGYSVLNISELQAILLNASYNQTISGLNAYDVSITSAQTKSAIILNNTFRFTIDWGDGNTDTYHIERNTITHVYEGPGTYSQTIRIYDNYGYTYSYENDYTVEYEGHVMHTALWVNEFLTPLLLLGLVGTGLSLGILFTETGFYLASGLLIGALPLYTRLDKEDVLDQFVRGQIYGYIKTNPGAHYNQIRRDIDVKNGTLAYHLRVLEKTELIKSRKEGVRYRAFYPVGQKFPKKERFRLTELQMRILKIIQQQEGLTQKEIASELHKKPQTINYNIKVLQKAELIKLKRLGRKSRCYVVEEGKDSEADNPALI